MAERRFYEHARDHQGMPAISDGNRARRFAFVTPQDGPGAPVKLTIELFTTGDDGAEARLSFATFSALTPAAARKEAVRRLAYRQKASTAAC
jgi:hypothetical protein